MTQMDARWREVERLFHAALALPAGERAALLERECAGNPSLGAEVADLLQSAADSGDFLDRPTPARQGGPNGSGLPAGSRLGVWRIVRELGKGGMGEVYEAVRADGGFEQRAALKLMRLDAPELLERFQVERQILARLDHPGIARLLDGGICDDGRAFAVMEYVDGRSITEHCRAHALDLSQRLALFVQVCATVAHAHRNLIVHRDLKPANILVDGEGRVRLLDFGIAKLLDPDVWGGAQTRLTQLPLTPDYCAPEQLTGETITTSTDIYALGLLLFELLTGRRPWQIDGQPLARAMHALLETSAPSASDAAARSEHAPVSARQLRGDLDAIVAMCLRREPARRYETVNALKRDVERHLAGAAVSARGGQRAYVFSRFMRRYRWPVTAVLLLVAILSGAAIYAQLARERAETALRQADSIRGFLVDLFALNDPEQRRGQPLSARELVDLGARRAQEGLAGDPDTRIELLAVIGRLYDSLGETARSAALFDARLVDAERRYIDGDPRLTRARFDVAAALRRSERFDQAEAMLASIQPGAGSSAPDIRLSAQLRSERAALAFDRGDYEAAVELGRQAVTRWRQVHPPDPVALAEALHMHGSHVFATGDAAAAQAPLREALALLTVDHGDGLSTLIQTRYRLSMVLSAQADFDEARRVIAPNVALVERVFGSSHPLLGDQLFEQARIERLDGEPQTAIGLYRRALAIYERVHGPEHSFVATSLTGLAQALTAVGQLAPAIQALERADRIYLKTLGSAHQFSATSATALAGARLDAGDASAAEAGYRIAITRYIESGNGAHVYVEAARRGLGEALLAQGRQEEAEPLLRGAWQRFGKEFGAQDFRSVGAAIPLAECLAALGRTGESAALIDSVEKALIAAGGENESLLAKLDQTRRRIGLAVVARAPDPAQDRR